VDAKRPRALVGRAVTGSSNIHALARAAFVSEIGCVVQRSEIEDRPNLLVLHVERLCSTLPGTIGDVISTKDQSGTTHGIHADDAHSVRYRQFENVAFFAEHSTESSKRVGIGQVTRRPYFAAGAVLAE